MNGKVIVYLSELFPAKQPEQVQTVKQTRVPTLGSSIGTQPTEEPDYRQAFRDWGW